MTPTVSWRGYIKFTLLQFAVAVYPATSISERTRFHLINRKTGNRLQRELYDPETGQAVDREDQVRGYEVSKNQYVVIEDEDLEVIQIESTQVIALEQFVHRSEIDQVYMAATHYCVPDDAASVEGFTLVREVLRRRDVVGIGRVVLSNRERTVMVEPRGKGLLVTTLRYPYEVRPDGPVFDDIPPTEVPADMLGLTVQAAELKTHDFDPRELKDRYEASVLRLLKAKRAGKTAPSEPAPPREEVKVINMMDALRRAIEVEKETAKPRPAARSAPSKRKPGGPEAKPSRRKK